MNLNNASNVIAAACHSAWYAYTVLALGEEGEPWGTAPDWQKDSIRNAVTLWDGHVSARLLEMMTPPPEGANHESIESWARDNLPELSHKNWMTHKASEGWIYGEVKDPEKKTHHCMVPYGDLPEDQKKKDLVVVEAYLAVFSELEDSR